MENDYESFVYKWTRDNGEYYIGKRKGHIGDGYIGSGKVFRSKYDKDPSRWTREILSCHSTDAQAYQEESRLVTEEVLSDPLCLNLQVGGNGGCTQESIAALPKGGDHHAAEEWVIRLMVDQTSIIRRYSTGSNRARGVKSCIDPIVASGKGILPKFCKDNELCDKQLGKTARGLGYHHKFHYAERVSK